MLDKLKAAAGKAADAASEAATGASDSVQRSLINTALDAVEKAGEEALKRDGLESVAVGAEFSLGPISLRIDSKFRAAPAVEPSDG